MYKSDKTNDKPRPLGRSEKMTTEDRIYRLIKLLLYTAKEEKVEVTATKLQKIFLLVCNCWIIESLDCLCATTKLLSYSLACVQSTDY